MARRRPDPNLIWAYCRVSTRKGEQELSLEEQLRWAKAFARDCDAKLRIFQERASAKTITGRPICAEMLRELENGETPPAYLVATSFDRLSRDMTDTLILARSVKTAGAKLYVRDRGEVGMDSFADQAAIVGQAMGGQAENEARSNRCKASWERRRREGKPASNKAPYGLQLRAERDIAEPISSPWVLRAFKWYAEGIGSPEIARRFAAGAPLHRVQTSRMDDDGKPIVRERQPVWEDNRIRKLLRQHRYRETIVPASLFDQVQHLLDTKPRWSNRRVHEYPFSGAVKCAGCGRSFHGHATGGGPKIRADGKKVSYPDRSRIRYYQCYICGYMLRASRLEATILSSLQELSLAPQTISQWVKASGSEADRDALSVERRDLQKKLDLAVYDKQRERAWRLALDNDISGKELSRQLSAIAEQEALVRDRIAAIDGQLHSSDADARSERRAHDLLKRFPELYESATYEQRRNLALSAVHALGGAVATKQGLRWLRNPKAEIPWLDAR